jgi:hypothetical protein
MIRHYYFIEEETGEEFIVGAKNFPTAEIIALDVAADIANYYSVFPKLSYEYEMTEEEAEESGLDEY